MCFFFQVYGVKWVLSEWLNVNIWYLIDGFGQFGQYIIFIIGFCVVNEGFEFICVIKWYIIYIGSQFGRLEIEVIIKNGKFIIGG